MRQQLEHWPAASARAKQSSSAGPVQHCLASKALLQTLTGRHGGDGHCAASGGALLRAGGKDPGPGAGREGRCSLCLLARGLGEHRRARGSEARSHEGRRAGRGPSLAGQRSDATMQRAGPRADVTNMHGGVGRAARRSRGQSSELPAPSSTHSPIPGSCSGAPRPRKPPPPPLLAPARALARPWPPCQHNSVLAVAHGPAQAPWRAPRRSRPAPPAAGRPTSAGAPCSTRPRCGHWLPRMQHHGTEEVVGRAAG